MIMPDSHTSSKLTETAQQRKRQASWRRWETMIQSAISLLNPSFTIESALDLGCGTGEVLELLRSRFGWNAKGADSDVTMLQSSCPKLHDHLFEIDITQPMAPSDFGRSEPFDLLWSSFAVQYFFNDFESKILPQWMALLSPGGLLILVETDGLLVVHEPLPPCTKQAFGRMENALATEFGYHTRAGSQLATIIRKAPGMELLADTMWDDAEFSFSGPASNAIYQAWEGRLNRMKFPTQFFPHDEWEQHQQAFLQCLIDPQHSTTTKIRMIVARKTPTHACE